MQNYVTNLSMYCYCKGRITPDKIGQLLLENVSNETLEKDLINLKEINLQSFIKLHFSELFGIKYWKIKSSEPLHSVADIIAIDQLGRLHIMELKNDKITKRDIDQALQYMFRYVFVNPDELVFYESDLQKEIELIGILTNQEIQKYKGKGKMSPLMFYEHLKTNHLTTIMSLSDYDEVAMKASLTAAKNKSEVPFRGGITPRQILWLVGPEFEDSAKDKIIELRENGIDARILECRLSKEKSGPNFWVNIEKEYNKERELLEKCCAEYLASNQYDSCQIEQKYYNFKPPSAKKTNSDKEHKQCIVIKENGENGKVIHTIYQSEAILANLLHMNYSECRKMLEDITLGLKSVSWPIREIGDEYSMVTDYQIQNNHGRMGIELFGNERNWNPGIFIGFMIDDHKIPLSDRSYGIDATLILDINRRRKTTLSFLESSDYKKLVDRLTNPMHDAIENDKKSYHPIHFRKSVYQIIMHSPNSHSKVDALVKQYKQWLNLLLAGGELRNYFSKVN